MFANNIDSALNDNQLTYEFTRDPDLLQQYATLVIQYYKKDLNLDLTENNLSKEITRCAHNEYIYIVRVNNRVIGGTKLTFCQPGSNQQLPMEEESFSVQNLLPNDFNYTFYGEIGRLVIDPSYRGKDILQNMVKNLMLFSLSHHCGFLFVLAPRLNAVLYSRICKQLRTPATIYKDITLPDKQMYCDLQIKLLSCDLYHLARQENLSSVG